MTLKAGDRLGPYEIVKLQSGEQRPWKELAPADRTGIYTLQPVRISSDCETYAYSVQYQPGTLFVVSGLR